MHLKKLRHHLIKFKIILTLFQHGNSIQTTGMIKTVTLEGSWAT